MKCSFFNSICLLFLFFLLGPGCSEPSQQKPAQQVVVWQLSDPQMLQPLSANDLDSRNMIHNLFQSLLTTDYNSLQLVPVLAESRPLIEKTDRGGVNLTFRIRNQAKWDNGSPVTARDVLFTLKAIFNPRVNNAAIKGGLDFISDVKLYADDVRKITICADSAFFLLESALGTIPVLPEYFYDPKGLMKEYTLKQVLTVGSNIGADSKIIEFADDMNSERRMRDKEYVGGSGPYKLEEWKTNKRVVLKRKKTYWGDSLGNKIPALQAFPDEIIYSTVNDLTSAVLSLKAGDLDVLYSIKPKDFLEMRNDTAFKRRFNLYNPDGFSYSLIGMNNRSKFLESRKTRLALTYLTDVDRIIRTVFYGFATRVVGPVPASDRINYNSDLTCYPFDLEKAKALLDEDGWKDTNGDGILDKVIEGQRCEFKISFSTNSGNEMRKAVGLIFQENARKAGIEVTILQQEFSTYFENIKNHKVDLFMATAVSSPAGEDFRESWHSTATVAGGNNFANYSNPFCDSLVDAIRTEMVQEKRTVLIKRFQKLMHEDVPFIFLYSQTERIAISKKFTNAEPSVLTPGFNVVQFKVGEGK